MDSQTFSQKIKADCPICLQPITNVMITNCRHYFCTVCLKMAMEGGENCPICRGRIDETECEWIAAEITKHRGGGRHIKYRVRWEPGHVPAKTWEPRKNLVSGTSDLLAQYSLRRRAVASKKWRNNQRKYLQ